ncbi:hypothetical protein A2U01_0021177 [Trifolium medium]|uniref:Uncharacterized protein n=1 Tax=Trifolium medium TaxID=97028 RepID=A0A392NLQ5_9FABA|nr:hypothetical protein [Trifolium medium]
MFPGLMKSLKGKWKLKLQSISGVCMSDTDSYDEDVSYEELAASYKELCIRSEEVCTLLEISFLESEFSVGPRHRR